MSTTTAPATGKRMPGAEPGMTPWGRANYHVVACDTGDSPCWCDYFPGDHTAAEWQDEYDRRNPPTHVEVDNVVVAVTRRINLGG